jgi:hypothetical protein
LLKGTPRALPEPWSWWGPFVSEGIFRLQLMHAGRALRRARLRPINPMGGERAVFTLAFSTSPFLLLVLCPPEPLLPLHLFPLRALLVPCPPLPRLLAWLLIIDPLAWERSTVTLLALNQLVDGGQIAANEDGRPAEWIVPSERERAPNPPRG